MANKQSINKIIKAKPNERGRTSHLPLTCSCSEDKVKCQEDFYVSKPSYPAKRKCAHHFSNPPQGKRQRDTEAMLRSMGLIA